MEKINQEKINEAVKIIWKVQENNDFISDKNWMEAHAKFLVFYFLQTEISFNDFKEAMDDFVEFYKPQFKS